MHALLVSLFGLALLVAASPASAHSLDLSYLDFGVSSSSEVTLTVAVHPHQVSELLPHHADHMEDMNDIDVDELREHAELIAAYVETHVSVSRNGEPCRWSVESAFVPETPFQAIADGVTVAGVLDCPGEGSVFGISATLFQDGFPNQKNVVRLDFPTGYAERLVLTREAAFGEVDIGELSKQAQPTPPTDIQDEDPFLMAVASTVVVLVILSFLVAVFNKSRSLKREG